MERRLVMASDQTGFTGKVRPESHIHYHNGSVYTDGECMHETWHRWWASQLTPDKALAILLAKLDPRPDLIHPFTD
jgi:hypothetical protein